MRTISNMSSLPDFVVAPTYDGSKELTAYVVF